MGGEGRKGVGTKGVVFAKRILYFFSMGPLMGGAVKGVLVGSFLRVGT